MQVWDCTIEDDLNRLIGTTYTNKIYLLLGMVVKLAILRKIVEVP